MTDRATMLALVRAAEQAAAHGFRVRLSVGAYAPDGRSGAVLSFDPGTLLALTVSPIGEGLMTEWRFASWEQAVDRMLALAGGTPASREPEPEIGDEDRWLRVTAAEVRAGGPTMTPGRVAGLLEQLAVERGEHRRREAELAEVVREQRRLLARRAKR